MKIKELFRSRNNEEKINKDIRGIINNNGGNSGHCIR